MLSLLRKISNPKSVGYQLRHVTGGAMDPEIATLKSLFMGAINSVTPKALFGRYLQSEDVMKQLQIPDKNYHLIGFGKAVLGMAVQMERILGDRLTSGCISIPVGTLHRFKGDSEFQLSTSTRLRIYECARSNLPDEEAVDAAEAIRSLAESMTPQDVVCVLVSGGGSALLPLPKSPVTLLEKLSVIKMLAAAGASIDELNVVRIQLSELKGGKLALSAKNSFKLLTFIVSDIVGDPIPLIASGPTVQSNVTNEDAWRILEKYNLSNVISKSVVQVLHSSELHQCPEVPGEIHLVGSNKIAIDYVASRAAGSNLVSISLTTRVQGNVGELSMAYVNLALSIVKFRRGDLPESTCIHEITQLAKILSFDTLKASEIVECLTKNTEKNVLIVAGGEPTVVLRGNGIGGRNQELALRFSYECSQLGELLSDVILLSAGTDGIDGPNDAAGAIGGAVVVEKYLQTENHKSIAAFIEDNDSHSFYRMLEGAKFHIVTGHTGTNVMDIHMLYIPWKK